MKNKYIDLIDQTFEFPQDEFKVEDGELYFHGINMMDIINQYGTPLKITYLPKISSQIQRAKRMFNVAMAKSDYKGSYHYCYCTKSSHFEFVLREALKNDIHIETSSAFDLNLIEALEAEGAVDRNLYIICNGFKKPAYIENIAGFANSGWHNIIPVLDNMHELQDLDALVNVPINAALLVFVGLCTSVMWGGIFNLAVEGLGKYTEKASGIFMALVCGGGILPLLQNAIVDYTNNGMGYLTSYWVIVIALIFLLYYAVVGSKNVNKDIPVND